MERSDTGINPETAVIKPVSNRSCLPLELFMNRAKIRHLCEHKFVISVSNFASTKGPKLWDSFRLRTSNQYPTLPKFVTNMFGFSDLHLILLTCRNAITVFDEEIQFGPQSQEAELRRRFWHLSYPTEPARRFLQCSEGRGKWRHSHPSCCARRLTHTKKLFDKLLMLSYELQIKTLW